MKEVDHSLSFIYVFSSDDPCIHPDNVVCVKKCTHTCVVRACA